MKARFVQSAQRVAQLPSLGLPEIAFIGRSNVGKSTLVGRILKQPRMVRTSRTPGRTQLLNLFVFEERIALMDLPGYGYAKLSKTDRARMEQMVREYLQGRESLCGVVQLIDARRVPVSPYDVAVADWVRNAGRPLLLAVTKSDLVPKNRRHGQLRKIEKGLGLEPDTALLCSGTTGEGREQLVQRMCEAAGLVEG